MAALARCDTMRHIEMKRVSIRELHTRTGEIVRRAAGEPIEVTDRGRVVAVLQSPSVTAFAGQSLPDRERWIARLPSQVSDSTQLVGSDRDR